MNKKSRIITNNIIESNIYKKANSIGVYLSFGKEVHTKKLIDSIFKHNKRCYVPKILDKKQMHMLRIYPTDEIEKFKKNKYGIMEPPNERENAIKVGDLDLLIVPGLGFDKNMNRLGRGCGYYDRYIAKIKRHKLNTKFVGICFIEQIVDQVITNVTDQKLDNLFFA